MKAGLGGWDGAAAWAGARAGSQLPDEQCLRGRRDQSVPSLGDGCELQCTCRCAGACPPCPGEGGHVPTLMLGTATCLSESLRREWLLSEKRISIAGCSFPASEQLLSVGGCVGFCSFFFNSILNLFQIKNKCCGISVCQT